MTRPAPARKSSGSAIATVICFVALLMILLTSLITTMRRQQFSVIKGLPPLQAKLMALSGVQHMLLKAKLCPTELYDAWALSKGRNPLFNFDSSYFGGKADPLANPGPRFVTGGTISGTDAKNTISIATADNFTSGPTWFLGDIFANKAWPQIGGTAVPNSQIYLWKFVADVTNRKVIQPVLEVATNTTLASGKDAYYGYYEISSIANTQVLGQKQRKSYDEDTISFEVTGRVWDDWGMQTSETVKSVVLIKRKN